MLFVIHCLDHESGIEKRLLHYEAHKAYLAAAPVKTLVSGPLVAEDGETMIGSLFIVQANSLDDVVQFNRNDPFNVENVWKDVCINGFVKRVDNRDGT